MRKEVKKIMAATLSLAMLIGAGNTVCSASNDKAVPVRGFNFKLNDMSVPKNSGDRIKRTTDKTNEAWAIRFDKSNEETTDDRKTYTIFYLGKINDGDINGYGSAKHKIKEGSTLRYYSAYRNVSPGLTTLYGKDNKDSTTKGYTVTGIWTPQTKHAPVHDDQDLLD